MDINPDDEGSLHFSALARRSPPGEGGCASNEDYSRFLAKARPEDVFK
jgi:hypothetical protein